MPELPEVETIRRGLEKELVGQKIVSVDVRLPKLFHGHAEDLIGQTVLDIGRRAKILVWQLTDRYLVIHLKMTGQLIFIPNDKKHSMIVGGHPDKEYSLDLPHKHTHIIIAFGSGTLYYNDLRRFGWMKVCRDEAAMKTVVAELGPEYNWPEFTLEYFQTALGRRSKTAVKTALLDQGIVAGLGNIYTDEVLFEARVLPDRKVGSLTDTEIAAIYKSIPRVLKVALEHGGTSMKDFRHVNGGWGTYLTFAKVYGRAGEKCKVCDTKLVSKKISARTATFCPHCQK